jgi:hypothetical protein
MQPEYVVLYKTTTLILIVYKCINCKKVIMRDSFLLSHVTRYSASFQLFFSCSVAFEHKKVDCTTSVNRLIRVLGRKS